MAMARDKLTRLNDQNKGDLNRKVEMVRAKVELPVIKSNRGQMSKSLVTSGNQVRGEEKDEEAGQKHLKGYKSVKFQSKTVEEGEGTVDIKLPDISLKQ